MREMKHAPSGDQSAVEIPPRIIVGELRRYSFCETAYRSSNRKGSWTFSRTRCKANLPDNDIIEICIRIQETSV